MNTHDPPPPHVTIHFSECIYDYLICSVGGVKIIGTTDGWNVQIPIYKIYYINILTRFPLKKRSLHLNGSNLVTKKGWEKNKKLTREVHYFLSVQGFWTCVIKIPHRRLCCTFVITVTACFCRARRDSSLWTSQELPTWEPFSGGQTCRRLCSIKMLITSSAISKAILL